MRRIAFFVMLMLTLVATAQTKNNKEEKKEPELLVYGQVQDFLTRDGVDTMSVVLLNAADSVFVDSATIDKWKNDDKTYIDFNIKVKRPGNYLIRIMSEGYKTKYVKFPLPKMHKRESYRHLPMTYLQKERKKWDVELDEVVVTASKVKFFMDGDTIVYNADAFDMPEGSMLNALIEKLPGVELKKGGEITVNGKKVSELQLNGKELMGSDNEMMLENLPAFMVKNVKVHERTPRDVKGTRREKTTPKETVMNVRLKREYAKGWIANAEAGITPIKHGERRWLGKLFLSRFSDNSRFSAYANVNNLNDSHIPGEQGDWSALEQTQGITETYKVGVTGNTSSADEVTTYNGNAELSYSEYEGENHTNSESFLPGGNTFGRSYFKSKAYNMSVSSNHDFRYYQSSKPTWNMFKTVYSRSRLEFSHKRSLANTLSASATLREDVTEQWGKEWIDSLLSPQMGNLLQKYAITRTINRARQKGRNTTLNFETSAMVVPLYNDRINLTLSGGYKFSDNNSPNYSNYTLESAASEKLNRYNEDFNRSHDGHIDLGAQLNLGENYWISPSVNYNYNNTRSNQSLYLLNKLKGWEIGEHPLGDLPSMDELMSVIDRDNSTISNSTTNKLTPRLSYNYQTFNDSTSWLTYFNASVSFPMTNERLGYQRAQLDTVMTRNTTFIQPFLLFLRQNYKRGFNLQAYYSMSLSAPSMTQMVDIVDTSNPLSRVYGNPDLKNTRNHYFSVDYSDKWKEKIQFNTSIQLSIIENAVAMGRIFDRTTGVSTMKPENINGNWGASGQVGVNIPFDKDMKYTLTNNVNYNYDNSVDLSSTVTSNNGDWEMTRSEVGTHTLTETLKLDIKPTSKLTLGAKGTLTYRNSTSEREDFMPIKVYDFNYGITGVYEMPWGLQFSTDLTMYSRRGYNDSSMNTNELVWNARLSKRIKNWSIMLDALDLLSNLSNVRYTINAQGRTETCTNVIPSYALLRIAWRMNKKPKK